MPGSKSSDTNAPAAPGPVATTINTPTPATPSSDAILNQPVPLEPKGVPKVQTSPGTSIPPPPSGSSAPPPPPRKPRRIIRKLFTTLLLLTLAGFGGGVYYSRINDNFHDFFTEYIPFGEEAVLFLEEREFKKRFPVLNQKPRIRDTGAKVTVPPSSGAAWRVAEEKPAEVAAPKKPTPTKEAAEAADTKKDAQKVEAILDKKDVVEPKKVAPEAVKEKDARSDATPAKMPEVDEKSVYTTYIEKIDPINIKNAENPVVQELVKIMNDIILVVNADKAGNKFSPVIKSAKVELAKVGDKINALKEEANKKAEKEVQKSHEEFDRAAKELIRRLEEEMAQQEAKWRDEYEEERQKLQQSYEQRLATETQRQKELNEQRLHNELLEQAVEMKRKFVSEVTNRVEEERDSRLGKLQDLSKTVDDLEKLTTDWNSVVESNLKTQHLHVAVEAVRATLERNSKPTPFVRELAALKEIADDDPVVDAAIASINPIAYQRGVPSSGQLIDRFRRVAGEVRKASLLPEEAGVASHASSYVLSKLLFKKTGTTDGDDVESILTRTETYLEEGRLDEAAREMNGLKGWAKTLSKDWLGEVRKVLEVQQALDVSTLFEARHETAC